jgi:hypothetical protein
MLRIFFTVKQVARDDDAVGSEILHLMRQSIQVIY